VPDAIGRSFTIQGRAPDAEHDGFDNPGPEHQSAADKRDRTEPGRDATRHKGEARDDKRCRDDPEEPRVFDGYFAF